MRGEAGGELTTVTAAREPGYPAAPAEGGRGGEMDTTFGAAARRRCVAGCYTGDQPGGDGGGLAGGLAPF